MGKIAFVFSGQGAQYVGMGKSLYDMGGKAKELYDEAESYRKGTMEQSFFGDEEALKLTANTQPCMYLTELGAALEIDAKGVKADGVAGFSLGEIGALAYAGAYSLADGFKIVTKRGELMGAVTYSEPTAMCAVLKLDSEAVKNIAAEFDNLYAVNFNCPGQVTVSGLASSMEKFEAKVKEAGGRVVPLAVSGAFHSPFMSEASEKFGAALADFEITAPSLPVYANVDAQPYGDDVITSLTAQMKSPVKWQETIENMIADGFTDFIEVGPGKTLTGLIKKISKEVNTYNVDSEDSLHTTVEAIKNA